MKYCTLIGSGILVIFVLSWRANDTVAASQDKLKTAEQRLQELELKVNNLERILGFQLDDESAVYRIEKDREEAVANAPLDSTLLTLQVLRSQLELYQVQHRGKYPDLAGNWDQLTYETDSQGRVYKSSRPGSRHFGPYLRDRPMNALASNASRVVTDLKQIGPGIGWYYKPETGELKAVVNVEVARTKNLSPESFVAY